LTIYGGIGSEEQFFMGPALQPRALVDWTVSFLKGLRHLQGVCFWCVSQSYSLEASTNAASTHPDQLMQHLHVAVTPLNSEAAGPGSAWIGAVDSPLQKSVEKTREYGANGVCPQRPDY
jgi:hypothetical protein